MLGRVFALIGFLVVLVSCEKIVYTSTNTLYCIDEYSRIEILLEDLTTGEVQSIEMRDDHSFVIETYNRPYLLIIKGFFEGETEPRAFYHNQFNGSLQIARSDGLFTALPYFVDFREYTDAAYFNWDYKDCGRYPNVEAFYSSDSAMVFSPENSIYSVYRSAEVALPNGKMYFGLKLSIAGGPDSAVVYSDIWNTDL